MPHKVPQNIDLEDKVIGPLTLKQFVYMSMGAGVIFVIHFLFKGIGLAAVSYFINLPVLFFFLALAFYKPGDRSFEVLLVSTVANLSRPTKRVWKKEPYKEKQEEKISVGEKKPVQKNYSSMDLKRLSFIVDAGGFEEELDRHGIISGINKGEKLTEGREMTDTLAPTEKKNESLTSLLKKAKEKKDEKKKEPSIQEMATVNPQKEFQYEKLTQSIGGLTEAEEVLKNAKETQEMRFEEASIHH